MKRCEVCKERPQATDDWMCKSCAADYDKRMIDRESAQGMVVWSARRARRFERARQRAEAKKTHGQCKGDHDPSVLEAIAELRKLREESRWIPVTERLPDEEDDGEIVLVFRPDYGSAQQKYFQNGHFVHENGRYADDVTHWRPLPAPPEVKP